MRDYIAGAITAKTMMFLNPDYESKNNINVEEGIKNINILNEADNKVFQHSLLTLL